MINVICNVRLTMVVEIMIFLVLHQWKYEDDIRKLGSERWSVRDLVMTSSIDDIVEIIN